MSWELAPLSWEAAATLATGLAAVAGAIVVSRKQVSILQDQVRIAGRQTDIQAGLASIEALKLKSELFGARFEVYDAVRKWLAFIVSEARSPRNHPGDAPDEIEVIDRFISAWDRSRFLFRPEVYGRLDELRKLSHALTYHQKMMRGPLNTDESIEANGKHLDGEHRILSEFGEVLENLSLIFGDELNLSFHGAVQGQIPLDVEDQ